MPQRMFHTRPTSSKRKVKLSFVGAHYSTTAMFSFIPVKRKFRAGQIDQKLANVCVCPSFCFVHAKAQNDLVRSSEAKPLSSHAACVQY